LLEKVLLIIYGETILKIPAKKYFPLFAVVVYSIVLIMFFLFIEVF